MTSQPGAPKWVELTDAYRQRLEITEEALSSSGENGAPASELERFRMLAPMHERHVSELLDALVSAEAQLELAQRIIQARAKPIGRGGKRKLQPTLADVAIHTRVSLGRMWTMEPGEQDWCVKKLRWLLIRAEEDRQEAIELEQSGQPLHAPNLRNMVCGAKGMSKRDAARQILADHAREKEPTAPANRIEDLVDISIEKLLKAYDRQYPKKAAKKRTK